MTDLIIKKIETAYSKLSLREPFIAAVMTRLERVVGEKVGNISIPTAGTDGKRVYFNPDFVDSLPPEELFGVVIHEALHVVFMHMWRKGSRDMRLWNYANDAIINRYILSRGYQLPEGRVLLDWVKEDMDSEFVYNKLKEDEQQGGEKYDAGGFDGEGDIHEPPEGTSQADMEASIVASAKMAKACGQGSSLIDKVISTAGESKVNWADETRAMLTAKSAADYSYDRPNRRFIAQNLYLPALYSEGLGGLLVAIDTSYSMSDEQINQIGAEIYQMSEDLRPEFIEVVYCDTEIQGTRRFEQGEDIELVAPARGGTRFKPVFDYIEKVENLAGVLYFTDMEGNLDECKEPDVPVIWALTSSIRGNKKPPFGVITHVEA